MICDITFLTVYLVHFFTLSGSKLPLQKQTSVGSYPQIQVSSFDSDLDDGDDLFSTISRTRPATVCVDRPSVDRRSDAEALALERPRKKLSFKEPEVENKKKPASDAKKLPNRAILSNNHAANDIGKSKLQTTRKSSAKSASDNSDNNFSLGKGIQSIAGLGIGVVTNGLQRIPSFEDSRLEVRFGDDPPHNPDSALCDSSISGIKCMFLCYRVRRCGS